jgi:hypothetical protein
VAGGVLALFTISSRLPSVDTPAGEAFEEECTFHCSVDATPLAVKA